jgi:hypothetical protein
MDSNLQFQQRLEGLPFGVIVIHARSNRMAEHHRSLARLGLYSSSVVSTGVARSWG